MSRKPMEIDIQNLNVLPFRTEVVLYSFDWYITEGVIFYTFDWYIRSEWNLTDQTAVLGPARPPGPRYFSLPASVRHTSCQSVLAPAPPPAHHQPAFAETRSRRQVHGTYKSQLTRNQTRAQLELTKLSQKKKGANKTAR